MSLNIQINNDTISITENNSITSEEENCSEYDGEQRSHLKFNDEIWPDEEILQQLLALPEADDIFNLINLSDSKETILMKNQETTLLLATWLGKKDLVEILLKNDVSTNITDSLGRTPLHLAACSNNVEILELLINYGANIEVHDFILKATPLHCAASKGKLLSLKYLIKLKSDVNVDLLTKSPLHYAVQSNQIDCVRELLENNAIPNTPQIFSETPLHVAASHGFKEIIELLLNYGAAVNVQCGKEKLTPLHLAAEDGNVVCTSLLIDAGAQIMAKNFKKQTPLHLAALSQCSETLELILSKGGDPNDGDKDGRTPLHSAIVKVSRSCECVSILLKFGANVNKQDNFGYTPLHLAALNEFSTCVLLFLDNNGDVTIRTKGGISVLSFITRKTPDVLPKYLKKFDNSIKLNDHEIGDVDCELKLDFRILVPTVGQKETDLLLNFIEVGQREILNHPLCETFLFLKWRKIRKFFLFSLFYHSVFVLLYTIFVIEVYLKQWQTNFVFHLNYILFIFNAIMLLKELFQIFHCWRAYIKHWENWLQWLIIISCFCTTTFKTSIKTTSELDNYWQHHVAAIGIFLTWLELMMIVGRFPIFGLYIQMFTTVSINFTKFIAAYFCLLVAFALSFSVLFFNYKSFNLKWVILKVIVMLSGELEYEDIFFDENAPIIYVLTAQIMFLTFVILVTVILTNLMVGLAVSDIQGLQKSAGLDRLVRQAELVAHLESMLFSPLLRCIPNKFMKFLHKQALLLKSQYHWALYIRPNDPREERIPQDLIKNIYHVVAERKEKPKSRKNLTTKQIENDLRNLLEEFYNNSRILKQKMDILSQKKFTNI